MKISREDVLRVAELAHLELAPEEIELYRNQLDEILSYIEKLQELDVSQVEPMTLTVYGASGAAPIPGRNHAAATVPLREDVPRDCHTAEEILKIAPDAVSPFFRVPKVIEK